MPSINTKGLNNIKEVNNTKNTEDVNTKNTEDVNTKNTEDVNTKNFSNIEDVNNNTPIKDGGKNRSYNYPIL